MRGKQAWFAALVILLLGILVVQFQQFRTLQEVAQSMAFDVPASSLSTSWKSGGVVVTVLTARDIGESDAALLVRHTKAVSAKLETHPIDN